MKYSTVGKKNQSKRFKKILILKCEYFLSLLILDEGKLNVASAYKPNNQLISLVKLLTAIHLYKAKL